MKSYKELWIAEMYEGAFGVFDTKEEAIEKAWMSSEENVYPVIETRALSDARELIDDLERVFIEAKHSKLLRSEIDEALALIDKWKEGK